MPRQTFRNTQSWRAEIVSLNLYQEKKPGIPLDSG